MELDIRFWCEIVEAFVKSLKEKRKMFSSKKKEASPSKKSILSTTSHSLNIIVSGTVIEGTIKSESDIRIDGVIKGSLNCNAKVIIGPTGFIEGEVRCQNAVIEGKFEGTLHVLELLHVRESAKVSGDVSTNKLIVQSGAVFNVACQMGAVKANKNSISDSLKSSNNIVKSTEKVRQES
ncbi:MAG: cytoskeletal protein CcmA (bactofilin family) [Saprospiraceae bacterium]|jgi:cytoskeletal protein CcmA (bactofilin family)